jgi:hypothetical protein
MRQSEYFRYGCPVKLHDFQKYTNEDKKIKFIHPPHYAAQPDTPGRTNLPGHLTDPHGTLDSVGLCISLCIINNITA